jgi:uncharacterized membrane protein YvbJ
MYKGSGNMVYCQKCGTKNEDDSEFCSKCGTDLNPDKQNKRERSDYDRYRNECFGVPYGGLIVGLFFGALLILIGISSIIGYDIWKYFGTIILVLVGIMIILGAIFGYRRRYGH